MNLKLSRYLVWSDCYFDTLELRNKVLCFSTRTQQYLAFEESLYTALKKQDFKDLSLPILNELIRCEVLVPSTEDELHTVLNRSTAGIDDNRSLYYVIQPTAQCQLGCGYCGQNHKNVKIDDRLQDNIIKRLEAKLEANNYKDLSIAWFGGEPLVAFSALRSMSARLIALAAAHHCSYGAKIVTNGLSLTLEKFKAIVNEMKITKIEITLDGSAEYHNARRHTKNGSSTFDQILHNLIAIANSEENLSGLTHITVRCNVDHRNIDGVPELIDLLASLQLQDKLFFYCAPIHSWGNDADKLSLTHQDFADKEIEWLIQLDQHGFNLSLLPKAKPIVCMAVEKESEVVDAYGNIFSCTEIPYVDAYLDSDYILGNAKFNPLEKIKQRSFPDFFKDLQDEKFTCHACPMLPVCGGSCPKQWYEGNIPCPSDKFNIGKKLLLQQLIIRKKTLTYA